MRPLRLFLERCFAGASELSEPVSSLWAIGAVASELSDVELLSPLPSSGRWSGPCLLCGRWSLEPALRNDVRRDIICWRLPDVSRLFFIKYCRRASFGSRLMHLGDGLPISAAMPVAGGVSAWLRVSSRPYPCFKVGWQRWLCLNQPSLRPVRH